MPKKKTNKILFLSLLGIFFVLACNISIIEGKGISQTVNANTGVISPFPGFPGDEVTITFYVSSGASIDVYILNERPILLLGPPSSNVVAQITSSMSGTLSYTISEIKQYWLMFLNQDSSPVMVQYDFLYIPRASMIVLIIAIISVGSIVSVIVIYVVTEKRKKSKRSSATFKHLKDIEQEDDINSKKNQK